MRAFGVFFTLFGVLLIAISARAISDPESPIGWSRWTDDPWSQGLVVGATSLVIGIVLLVAKQKISDAAELRTTRALSSLTAGVLGFLLLAPMGATTMCTHGIDGGGCTNQSWSTITGRTFEGDPNPASGLTLGLVLAATAWFFVDRLQKRSQRPAARNHSEVNG